MREDEKLNSGIKAAILVIGSQKAFAQKVGCAQSTVSDWLNCRKKVSPEYVPLIVRSTGGEVKAHEIRPDLPDIFPASEPTNESARA